MAYSKFLFIFLSFALFSQFFVKIGIFTDYIVRYDYYKNTLCINKSIPKLSCNGKCALAKKIQSLDNENSDPAKYNRLEKTSKIDLFFKELGIEIINSPSITTSLFSSQSSCFIKNYFEQSILKPPIG
jgi:hypothetical protein